MNLMEYITDWLYQMVVGVFSELFTAINTLGSDMFGQPWVQQIVGLVCGRNRGSAVRVRH